KSGKWFLIEVNPRHWDQHEVGAHVGINLSWIAYQDMIGRQVGHQVAEQNTATQFRWIAETEALMLILRNAYTQVQQNRGLNLPLTERLSRQLGILKASFREAAFLLKGRKVFAVFHRRDPIPGVLLCLRTIRELCEAMARSLNSKKAEVTHNS